MSLVQAGSQDIIGVLVQNVILPEGPRTFQARGPAGCCVTLHHTCEQDT